MKNKIYIGILEYHNHDCSCKEFITAQTNLRGCIKILHEVEFVEGSECTKYIETWYKGEMILKQIYSDSTFDVIDVAIKMFKDMDE